MLSTCRILEASDLNKGEIPTIYVYCGPTKEELSMNVTRRSQIIAGAFRMNKQLIEMIETIMEKKQSLERKRLRTEANQQD
ncbi:hypothetical protein QTP88_003380 [Uroleucon formosanum]